MELHSYTPDFERRWEYFVNHSDNGTIFHLRRFIGYHPPNRFDDRSVIFMRKGKLYAVFPAAVVKQRGNRILFSHPGASYGGFVVGESIGLEATFEMVALIIRYARDLDCDRIVITQTPSYYFTKYSSYVDFALQKNGFFHRKRELSSVLSLDQPADRLYHGLPDGLKRAIRKAERSGVRVCRSRDVEAYYAILENNLSMRHNVHPTHTEDELRRLFGLFKDRIVLYAAKREGEMIGGVVAFDCNPRVNLAFYIAHNHAMQRYRPVDLIIHEIIRDSEKRGFTYLDFGTFTLDMEPNWGLCRYKEKFGARGVFRDTFERRL